MHVVPCLGTGGLELALARLSRALQERGAVQAVAVMSGDLLIADKFAPGITLQALHGKPNEWALPRRLRAVIREFRPHVIHCRNWGAWPDTVRARGFIGSRPPLVFSFHGTTEPAPMPWRRRAAFRVLARWTTELFTVSEAARTRLVEEVGLPRKRIGLIPNGIDVQRYASAPQRRTGERFIIGTVGNLNPIKNQALLVRALSQLRADGVDAEVRIAGEGALREPLVALARELGVQDRLHLSGHVDDIPAFLAQLSAFVLCSKLEAHPNSLIEAMAAHLPCVGTNTGGIPEVLLHGAVGHLTPEGDAAALASALRKLHDDPAQAAALAARGRAHCESVYSLDAMVRAYACMYTRLAAQLR